MERFIAYAAAERGLSAALKSVASSQADLFAATRERLLAAIGAPARRRNRHRPAARRRDSRRRAHGDERRVDDLRRGRAVGGPGAAGADAADGRAARSQLSPRDLRRIDHASPPRRAMTRPSVDRWRAMSEYARSVAPGNARASAAGAVPPGSNSNNGATARPAELTSPLVATRCQDSIRRGTAMSVSRRLASSSCSATALQASAAIAREHAPQRPAAEAAVAVIEQHRASVSGSGRLRAFGRGHITNLGARAAHI